MQRELIGSIYLGSTCDLTDPCYNRDVWCRSTVEDMLPGIYNCYAYISDEGEWGMRVAESVIMHEQYEDAIMNDEINICGEYHVEHGVDAGLFGYFDNKPDFSDEEWSSFCDELFEYERHHNGPLTMIKQFDSGDGFFTSSGYGDGGYTPFLYRDIESGKVVGVSTCFI